MEDELDTRVVKLFSPDLRWKNQIQTNKYKWYDFIPKNLWEQFSQLGNLYFLIVATLQLIPAISNTKGRPATLMPLSVVVLMQAIKDVFEDSQRIASDFKENNRQATMVSEKLDETRITWGNIRPGMVLKIKEGELIPADCLILLSSHADGHCSVETANLDGETNLKKKSAALSKKEFEDAAHTCRFIGMGCAPSLICEAPNGDLYSFKSSLCLPEEESRGLGVGSLLMRGTSLQQTPWVLCMAVYVGSETRSFKNLRAARFKSSVLDEKLNTVVAMIFVGQIGICVLISICGLIWQGVQGHQLWYLEGLPRFGNPLKHVGIWFLMLNSMVPLSMMITVTVVKFAQGSALSEDEGTFSKGRKAEVHTSQVIDSLGQVTHVFSDKTGTLTQNLMEYRCCGVGKTIYGLEDLHDVVLQEDHVLMDATDLSKAMKSLTGRAQLTSFFLCHALCHTVEPATTPDSPYNASSPDELALVCAAGALGLKFVRVADNYMQLDVSQEFERLLPAYGWRGGMFQAELLEVCEFDNVRKRMSVVLRMPDGEVLLYVKGADSSILPHAVEQDEKNICEEQLLTFARKGLRTLCLAERSLDAADFKDWSRRFHEAKAMVTEDRAEKIHELSVELETRRPVRLLGATAIDDKLQDEVPETIEQLRWAGVRVWVLTGDKVDTAISIAMSCKLLTEDMNNFVVDSDTTRGLLDIFQDVLEADEPALTIAGSKLGEAMEDEESRSLLFRAGQRCRSVICCRVSPKQKADVVDLVKSLDKGSVTLSIGDGANDVSMIVAAHVGIGLCGKEGAQAARSADFALAEFRLLRRVIFGHGREAYRRNSMVCIYSFYKNQVNVLITIMASVLNAFSGPNVVNPWLMQCFNIIHCHMPIFVYAMHDKSADMDVLERDPKGHSPYLFGMDVQCLWMVAAFFQSLLIMVCWTHAMDGITGEDGPDLAQTRLLGNLCFISVVLAVNVALMFRQYTWPLSIVFFYCMNLLGLVGSVLICVRGISQVLGANLIRVSLTILIVLVLTTVAGETTVTFMELFNDQDDSDVPSHGQRAEPLVSHTPSVRLTRPSLGFAFSEECSIEREKDRHCSVSFPMPETGSSHRATIASTRPGERGDIELSFISGPGSSHRQTSA